MDPRLRPSRSVHAIAAFTLMEILVVVLIILALSAIALGAMYPLLGGSRDEKTRNQVLAVAAALNTYHNHYGIRAVSVMVGAQPGLRPLWDLDNDRLLDGDPTLPEARSSLKAIAPDWYRGTARMALLQGIEKHCIDPKTGEILDPWGQPLRVRWGEAYGVSGIGVWSVGPDGKDGFDGNDLGRADTHRGDGFKDDICSWIGRATSLENRREP